MFSIALIGADGAGKTTIAGMLLKRLQLDLKYIYMGINIESSNIALPTSRLAQLIKRARAGENGHSESGPKSLHHQKKNGKKPAGTLWAVARLLNRVSEEWYRQVIAWSYHVRGYATLYDRHFLFDFPASELNLNGGALPLPERIHRYCLERFFPRPHITIFLDAPAEVLFARKGEASLEYLTNRQKSILQQGKRIENFFRVDATQPLEEVYSQVEKRILSYYGRRNEMKVDKITKTNGNETEI